jgi:polyisoprenyl-phosphate glycosyltransferase
MNWKEGTIGYEQRLYFYVQDGIMMSVATQYLNRQFMPNSRKLQSLAVVVPLFNEQAVIRPFYEAVSRELDQLGIPYQFVFVDDGSVDNTLRLLNDLADQDDRVTVLSFTRNFGHQIALTAGLDHADADAIVTMDGDLQHPPSAIARMIEAYEAGAEVVYAVRGNQDQRGILKRSAAHYFYRLLKRLTRVEILEDAKDFRLLSRSALEAIQGMRETHRFLRGMVPWMGFEYQIIKYEEQARFADESKYSWKQLARLARYGFFSFSTASLDMITILGFSLTGVAMLYLVYALVAWASWGQLVPGWTSVIVVVLIVSGVQLISVGILAQYIGMIFEEVKGRPLYLLKQKRVVSRKQPDMELTVDA